MIAFFSSPSVDFMPADDAVIDVHSFSAKERLAIHQARCEADLWSRCEPAKPANVNLLIVRDQTRHVMDDWKAA